MVLQLLPITLDAVIAYALTPALCAKILSDGAREVYDTACFRSAGGLQFGGCEHDCLVSINSTPVVSPTILSHFPRRAINCHPDLLPEYGGLHVHLWAIRSGETTFGDNCPSHR